MKKLIPAAALLVLISAAQAQDSSFEVFGTYSMGCMAKSMELPRQSPLYQVQLYGADRNFGHPSLIDFILKLANKGRDAGLPPLLIGDLSRPNGGPYRGSSHSSHQLGLDVDIAFDFASPRKSVQELRKPKNVYIVNDDGPTQAFDGRRAQLIKLAAEDDRVERIFVHPRIKEHMCKLFDGQDRSWLSKVRPWFGHRAHLHVRLKCPADSPYCEHQQPVPQGDGCGYELQSWFLPPDPKAKPTQKARREKPKMPAQCKSILGLKS